MRVQPVHGELRHAGGADDLVLRSIGQAAAQVISRETGLEPHLDAGTPGRERHLVRVVGNQRVDVCLRGSDALDFGKGTGRGHQIRSMIVPVDSAPPAHMVISAVLWSVRSNSCSAVVISRLPVLPTG